MPCPAARHDPAGNPTRRSAPGSWVYFPSFFQTDTNTSGADDEAAATLLQVAWRLHKAYAAVHAADAAVNAAATKLQRAARRHLQGRSCKPWWPSNLSLSLSLSPRLKPIWPWPLFPAGYWALPLTTIVLERLSPSRMSWKKEKKPQVHAAPTHPLEAAHAKPVHVASLWPCTYPACITRSQPNTVRTDRRPRRDGCTRLRSQSHSPHSQCCRLPWW